MKITQRCFFFVLSCLLTILPAFPHTPDQKFLVYVGTYTDKTDSKGVYAYEFDASTGKLTARGLAAETPNPSWVVIHPNGKWAYAANESGKQSSISAFSIDPKSAKLTLLNKLSAAGEDPCYLSFDKTGKYLFVANYTSGNVVVFPILPDGKLGAHTADVKDAGTLGPNKERQEAPHAHWIQPSGDNRLFYVADLGLDRITAYIFDATNGTVKPGEALYADPRSGIAQRSGGASFFTLSPGNGPRHAAISNDGKFIYVLGELASTVTVFADDDHHLLQIARMLPAGFSGRNDAAEIALHPNGKWLFASNRGHDSIVVFAVDPVSGALKLSGDYPTGGKEPRHFAIDPTGQFLLAENENSNSIVVFRINPATGALSQVSIIEGIPSPVCLAFYPAH
jgi:6-phosphogluconolactonase